MSVKEKTIKVILNKNNVKHYKSLNHNVVAASHDVSHLLNVGYGQSIEVKLEAHGEVCETIVKGKWTLFATSLKLDQVREPEGVLEVVEC